MNYNWFCYEQWRAMPPVPVLYHQFHPELTSKTVVRNTIVKVPATLSLKEAEAYFLFKSGGGDFVRT